ncbi:hypothetical protein NQ314_010945 [Rhamnusium bicolor]|uniref:HTH psq-type domain-containing protein n=1 Tax=Rhamnusium bicolor TaxID=1586634 RepID=A0AAV8XMV2_9CUCU|nr:hypothetical protein NQ314_010945 [Rhamnusium bicolor]
MRAPLCNKYRPRLSNLAGSSTGRPKKTFQECSTKTKRKVLSLLQTYDTEELAFAAEVSVRSTGKRDGADLIKEIASASPSRATHLKKAKKHIITTQQRPYRPDEALACRYAVPTKKKEIIVRKLKNTYEKQSEKTFFQYTEETLQRALFEIIQGNLSINKASQAFNVPKTTIIDTMKGRSSEYNRKTGPESILGQEVENKLKEWVLNIAKCGFPLKKELLEAAEKIAKDLQKMFQTTLNGYKMKTVIMNGFKKCGLFPMNPDNVDYTKCVQNLIERLNPSNVPSEMEKDHINFNEFRSAEKVIRRLRNTLESSNINVDVILNEIKALENEKDEIVKVRDIISLNELTVIPYEEITPIEKLKGKQKEKLPSAITSAEWRAYYNKKNDEKNRKLEEAKKKKDERLRNKAIKEAEKVNKKQKSKEKALSPNNNENEKIKCAICEELISDDEKNIGARKYLTDDDSYKILHEESSDDEQPIEADDEEISENEEVVTQSDHNTDSEQENSVGESDVEETSDDDYFLDKDEMTKWCKKNVLTVSKTKSKNLPKIVPGQKESQGNLMKPFLMERAKVTSLPLDIKVSLAKYRINVQEPNEAELEPKKKRTLYDIINLRQRARHRHKQQLPMEVIALLEPSEIEVSVMQRDLLAPLYTTDTESDPE